MVQISQLTRDNSTHRRGLLLVVGNTLSGLRCRASALEPHKNGVNKMHGNTLNLCQLNACARSR